MKKKKPIWLILLLFIAVLALGYFVVVPLLDFSISEVADELSLKSVTTPSYSFYYPKNFVKKDLEGMQLAYFAVDKDGNDSGETVMLEVRANDPGSKKVTPTSESCQAMANGVIEENPSLNGTLVSSIVTDTHPEYEGCKFVINFSQKDSSMTVEVKSIWYKDARDNNLYLVKGNYYPTTSTELARTIKDAINQFSIK